MAQSTSIAWDALVVQSDGAVGVALRDIAAGETIGIASVDIATGAHVHKLASRRARRAS